MNNLLMKCFALLAAALLVTGCAGQREPATRAIAEIEASLNALREDAGKYAASDLQQAEAGLASLRNSLANKDYKAVIAAAPAVTVLVGTLQQTVDAKRQEVQAAVAAASDQWRSLSTEVPDMVAAIQSRVDILGQSKKLPKNLKAESFQAAKDGLEWMKSQWTEAAGQFGAGDPVDAVAKAQAIKAKGAEVLQLLGMG